MSSLPESTLQFYKNCYPHYISQRPTSFSGKEFQAVNLSIKKGKIHVVLGEITKQAKVHLIILAAYSSFKYKCSIAYLNRDDTFNKPNLKPTSGKHMWEMIKTSRAC